MIWDKLETENWQKAAPYVDTALIPIVNVYASSKEKWSKLEDDALYAAAAIERQLTGRVMLMPLIPYITNESWCKTYVGEIGCRVREGGFTSAFFILAEKTVRELPDLGAEELVLVPVLSANEAERSEQIQQLCEQIIGKWQKEV